MRFVPGIPAGQRWSGESAYAAGSDDSAYLIDFGIAESRGDTRLTNTGDNDTIVYLY